VLTVEAPRRRFLVGGIFASEVGGSGLSSNAVAPLLLPQPPAPLLVFLTMTAAAAVDSAAGALLLADEAILFDDCL